MRAWLGGGALALLSAMPAVAAAEPKEPAELRVISDRTESHLAPIFAAFEKARGVKVSAVYLDKGLVSRLETRPTEADLVITKDGDLLELAKQKGLLQPYSSARITAVVPADLRDGGSYYFTDSYRARAIFYSKDRVKPEELSSYAALADPKWKGRVCVRSGYHDYNLSLLGQMLVTEGPEKTRAFVKGLRANLARTPTGNDRDQVKAILEKKCDVALVNSYYMGIMLSSADQRAWAESARVFFPNQDRGGTYVLRSGVALTKSKEHVKLATELMEFLVSDDAQDITAGMTYAYPANPARPLPEVTRQLGEGQPGIKDGVFKIRAVPLKDVAAQRDAVLRLLDETQFDKPL